MSDVDNLNQEDQVERERRRKELYERLMEISKHCASLPDLDTRTPDEIIGYNEFGVPE